LKASLFALYKHKNGTSTHTKLPIHVLQRCASYNSSLRLREYRQYCMNLLVRSVIQATDRHWLKVLLNCLLMYRLLF